MEIIKKKRIVVRTTRRLVVCQSASKNDFVCRQCESDTVSPAAGASFFGIGSRTIYRLIEAGEIHFIETENDEIYICLNSLKQILTAINKGERIIK